MNTDYDNLLNIYGIVKILLDDPGLGDKGKQLKRKFESVSNVIQNLRPPEIGLIGDLGSGKSSLLTAISTGGRLLLPLATGGVSITRSVVKIKKWDKEDIRVTLEPISKEAWNKKRKNMAEILLNHYQDGNKENEDSLELLNITKESLESIYGYSFDDDETVQKLLEDDFEEIDEIVNLYSNTQEVKSFDFENNEDVRNFLVKYLCKPEAAKMIHEDPELKLGSYLWPLIKTITVQGPFENVPDNVVLVDFPGSDDVKWGGENDTKSTCNYVWLVNRGERINDSKSFKRILKEVDVFWGNHLLIVATKTEDWSEYPKNTVRKNFECEVKFTSHLNEDSGHQLGGLIETLQQYSDTFKEEVAHASKCLKEYLDSFINCKFDSTEHLFEDDFLSEKLSIEYPNRDILIGALEEWFRDIWNIISPNTLRALWQRRGVFHSSAGLTGKDKERRIQDIRKCFPSYAEPTQGNVMDVEANIHPIVYNNEEYRNFWASLKEANDRIFDKFKNFVFESELNEWRSMEEKIILEGKRQLFKAYDQDVKSKLYSDILQKSAEMPLFIKEGVDLYIEKVMDVLKEVQEEWVKRWKARFEYIHSGIEFDVDHYIQNRFKYIHSMLNKEDMSGKKFEANKVERIKGISIADFLKENGLEVVEIDRNGNCILNALRILWPTEPIPSVSDLRKEVYRFFLEGIIPSTDTDQVHELVKFDYYDYHRKIEKNKAWLGEGFIYLISRMYGLKLTVIQETDDGIEKSYFYYNEDDSEIFLIYNGVNHYHALVKKELGFQDIRKNEVKGKLEGLVIKNS